MSATRQSESVSPEPESSGGLQSSSDFLEGSSTTDRSCSRTPPPIKKPRTSGCVYDSSWKVKYPWIQACPQKGKHYAWCKPCGKPINIKAGSNELRKHEGRKAHKDSVHGASMCASLTTLLQHSTQNEVIRGEILIAMFLAEHHIAIRTVDHLTDLIKAICHDSEIAKKLKCHRTKATALLQVVSHDIRLSILKTIGQNFFSIAFDETTDISTQKIMVTMLRYFDSKEGSVRTMMYKIDEVPLADAHNLFNIIDGNLSHDGLSYDKLVSATTDGANVMVGAHNSVTARLREKQSQLYTLHCPCHISALISTNACQKIPAVVEQLVRDIFSHFSSSPKRQFLYSQFQTFVDCKPHKLLRPSQTRWLSLQQVVDRTIEQYPALLSYFKRYEEQLVSIERIVSQLENTSTLAYLLFLSEALQIINAFNLVMQREKPCIHILYRETIILYKKILMTFLKPTVVSKVCSGTLDDLKQCIENRSSTFLIEEEVDIGLTTRTYLDERINAGEISNREVQVVREICTSFWIEAATQARRRLPLDNRLIQCLGWLFPHTTSTYSEVIELAKFFPNIVPLTQLPQLKREFTEYQCAPIDCNEVDDIAIYWHKVSLMKDPAGDPRFPLLTMLAKAILTINHSNVDSERLFSQYGLSKTKHRNRLGIPVMNALLTIQFNVHTKCYEFVPSTELVKKCTNPIRSLKTLGLGTPTEEECEIEA